MDCQNLNHLLRMAIADALRELNKVPPSAPCEERAIKILDDALADVFSNENMQILFPEEEEPETVDVERAPKRKKRRGGSWVELKTINNCGPYAYKRWREGKVTKSKYIGKVVT